MSRARWTGLGVLVLLMALLPFVPRGGGDDGSVRTTSSATRSGPLTAGYGRVTPAFRRTIDRVVAEGATAMREVRGSALLPRHRLDGPHAGRGPRPGGPPARAPGRKADRRDEHR
jgi:hypothetical protein